MDNQFKIIGSGQVNEDGTQPTFDPNFRSFSNFESSRISAGRYLITIPVALAEGALQAMVVQGDSGGRNQGLVKYISPTTFEVHMTLRGALPIDPSVPTDCAFNLVVFSNAGVGFDDAFDIAGMANVESDGSLLAGSPEPGWVPSAIVAAIYPLTCSAAQGVQTFAGTLLVTMVGAVPNQFALRGNPNGIQIQRVRPYDAAFPLTTIAVTAFAFVVIVGHKRS